MNIAIAGCGPAGLASALILHAQGHDVTLLERFATPTPVGSGFILQPTGLAVLRELGLRDRIHALGKRIERMHGVTMPAGREVLNVNYAALGEGMHGLAVHRAALFELLFDAVAGTSVEIRTSADVIDVQAGARNILAADSRGISHGPFDLLVDASGAMSKLQSHALRPPRRHELKYGAIWGSFDWPAADFRENVLQQRYVGAHTMAGVLPIGRHADAEVDQVAFFWSLKTADYDTWLAAGLDSWKQQVRTLWPETEVILEQIVDATQMSLAKYGHSTLRIPHGDRIVFVGDSAHSTSPQLGQGANMALLDAWALGTALRETSDVAAALRKYAKIRRWHVRTFQLASLALTPFYQSDSRVLAGLRDLLFDPVSRLPIARRLVAGLISGLLAMPPRGLDYSGFSTSPS